MNKAAKFWHRLKTLTVVKKVQEIFSLDPRSLALFRIALGLLIIVDLVLRARYMEAHYTDRGILPRFVLLEHFSSIHLFSFHLLSGEFWVMSLLFIINGVFALMLVLGWKTRLMSYLCWFFLMSLHNRNTQLLQGGDVLFRMILLWGCFLPLGRFWSIDTRNSKEIPDQKKVVFSAASFAYIIQILILYVTAANHKIADPWIKNLDGVYLALNAEHFATSFAQVMLQYPEVLKFLSLFTLYCEAALPFVLICPIYFQYARFLGVLMLICMHIGFAMCLSVGLFWLIDVVALLALLPSLTWSHLESLSIYGVIGQIRETIFDQILLLASRIVSFLKSKLFSTIHSIASALFVLGSIVYIIFWIAPCYPGATISIPPSWQWYGELFGMDQRWQMFSPYPMKDDGWWVVIGKLKDDTEVDVLERKVGPVSFEKPKLLYKTMVTDRWRKYYRNLLVYKEKAAMLYYAKGLCRNWNTLEEKDEKKLNSFEIYYMLELTLPNYQKPEVKKEMRWRHFCFEVPEEYHQNDKKED